MNPHVWACNNLFNGQAWKGIQMAPIHTSFLLDSMTYQKHVQTEDLQLSIAANVNNIAHICHQCADEAGWWVDTETGDDVREWPKKFFDLWVAAKLMLIVTEVAESMEGHRKALMDDHLKTRPMIEVELADALIRIGDLAKGLRLDLGGAVAAKLAYNANRADHKMENRLAAGGKSV